MLSLIHEFLVVRTSFIVRDNSSVRNTFQPLMQKAVTLRARNARARPAISKGGESRVAIVEDREECREVRQ